MTARLPLLALAAWTLFVWGGRLRNLAIDDGSVSRWSLVGSIVFTVLGLAVAVLALVAPGRRATMVAIALAVLSIVVWLIRGVDIALGDHSAGFIAVHTVLALVSIALGAWVLSGAGRVASTAWVNQSQS